MHLRVLVLLLLMSPLSTDLFAATRYVALNGLDSNTCLDSENIDTPKRTFVSALSCLSPGDTLLIRGGTWTEQIDLQGANKSGTPGNWITIGGYPGETVIIRFTDPSVYGPIKVRGAKSYFVFQDMTLDGINQPLSSGWQIRDGNHHFILRRLIIENQNYHGLYVSADDITVEDSIFRNARAPVNQTSIDCTPGFRHVGWYIHDGNNIVFRRNEIRNMPGGGGHLYPGPADNVVLDSNLIVENSWCSTQTQLGWNVAASSTGGNLTGVVLTNNVIANNNPAGTGGNGAGIAVAGAGGATVTGARVENNTIYNNQARSGSFAYGILVGAGAINTIVKNNIVTANETGQILTSASTNTTVTHNACLSGDSCGTTGKVTLSSATEPFVNAASEDFRLKAGTNPVVDTGTTVAARPSPVGVTDIGAFERGLIASAAVATGYIEVTVNVMTAPVLPGAGCTGVTIANGTSTGTPVVDVCAVKAGASNVLQLTVSGFTGSGTCTLSYSGGNVTDSGYVGPVSGGISQGINSASGVSVSGTCDNTAGGSPPASGLYSVFALDEGSGTTATDSSGNANHGTVSAGVTWVNDTSGTGVSIPTDATFRHVASTYGQGIDIEETSVSVCALVLPDLQYSQKVVVSAGGNGSSQRFYFGWATVGGVQQWGSGVGASGFTSGATEFPASPQLTLVCLRANAATDTATLSVNRTIGTSAAAVKSTVGFTTLVDDLRAGNDGTFTTNNGGYTVYGMWVWENTYLADSDVQDLYDTLFATGGAVGGYAQKAHRWQGVYLDGNGDPVTIGTASTLEVVQGGAVALEMQVDCTGGACDPVALRLYVSDIAGNTTAVPQSIGAFGVGMWGASTSAILNRNVSSCCITGALTANDGVTLLDAVATNTIELAQDSSVMFRWIVTIGQNAPVDEELFFFPKQDNGAELDGAAGTVPTIRVIAPQASGGF